MSVYVDNQKNKYGYMKMCHMIADNLSELHDMADKIGIQRKWFQNHRIPHYDICLAKRKLAIKNGAIEITTRDIIRKAKHGLQ